MRSVTPILCVALLALPSATLGQASPDEQAIAEANAAWEAAFNAGDGAGMAALYTEDAMLLPPGGESVEGRAAIEAFWQSAIEELGVQAALKTSELEIHGDMATEVGSFVDTGADGAHVDHGKYVVLWKKVDGDWKLHRDIWNSSMTP